MVHLDHLTKSTQAWGQNHELQGMFYIHRMSDNPKTQGHPSFQAPLAEWIWLIKSTCHPVYSVRVPHIRIQIYISPPILMFTLVDEVTLLEVQGERGYYCNNSNNWRVRGTLFYTAIVTSLYCLVSSSAILSSLLFPKSKFPFFSNEEWLSNLYGFHLIFYWNTLPRYSPQQRQALLYEGFLCHLETHLFFTQFLDYANIFYIKKY